MLRSRVVGRIVVVTLLLLLTLVTLTVVNRANRRTTPSVAISADQIPRVTAADESGDGGAAARLSRHYLEMRDYRNSWIRMEQAKRLGYPAADSNLTEMRKFFPPDAITEDSDATRHQ